MSKDVWERLILDFVSSGLYRTPVNYDVKRGERLPSSEVRHALKSAKEKLEVTRDLPKMRFETEGDILYLVRL